MKKSVIVQKQQDQHNCLVSFSLNMYCDLVFSDQTGGTKYYQHFFSCNGHLKNDNYRESMSMVSLALYNLTI